MPHGFWNQLNDMNSNMTKKWGNHLKIDGMVPGVKGDFFNRSEYDIISAASNVNWHVFAFFSVENIFEFKVLLRNKKKRKLNAIMKDFLSAA